MCLPQSIQKLQFNYFSQEQIWMLSSFLWSFSSWMITETFISCSSLSRCCLSWSVVVTTDGEYLLPWHPMWSMLFVSLRSQCNGRIIKTMVITAFFIVFGALSCCLATSNVKHAICKPEFSVKSRDYYSDGNNRIIWCFCKSTLLLIYIGSCNCWWRDFAAERSPVKQVI